MPIYEYQCQTCGSVSEFLVHNATDSEKLECCRCGNRDLHRLLSVPNLMKEKTVAPGHTCCGRTERCETSPCSSGNKCHRD